MKKLLFVFLALNGTIYCQFSWPYCELKNIQSYFLDVTYDGSSENLLKYFTTKDFVKLKLEDNTSLLKEVGPGDSDCTIWLEFLVHEGSNMNQYFGRVHLMIWRDIYIPKAECKSSTIVYDINKHVLINPNNYDDGLKNYFNEISTELIQRFIKAHKDSNL